MTLPVDDLYKIPAPIRKFGVYKYKDQYYINKYRALQDAGTDYVQWVFNDDVFGKYDFTREPSEDMYALYAKRAWQIREKYDKVVIYFSGGIYSTCVLRTFVDNNIPIDAVVVCGAWSGGKYSEINTAEQTKVAIPYLKMIERERNIKLNVHFLDVVDAHRHYNEDWIYSNSYNLVPACIAYNYYDQDPFLQNIMMQGNACTVRGVDKPRVICEDGKWYLAFLDSTLGGSSSYSNFEEKPVYLTDEFFYWTPDLVELVIKQAHVIVSELERRFDRQQCETKFTKTAKFDKIGYGKLVEPIVYGKYVKQEIGGERPYFNLNPPYSSVYNPKSWWFLNAKDEFYKDVSLFAEGINSLSNIIDPMHFNKVPSDEKFNAWLKKAPVDKFIVPKIGSNSPLFGTVGCWSPWYHIKDYGLQ